MVTLTETAAKKLGPAARRGQARVGAADPRGRAAAAPACRTSSAGTTPPADGDNVVESHGVKVYVDTNSAPYLQGSEIDYVDNNMMGAGFAIKNPNVKSAAAAAALPPVLDRRPGRGSLDEGAGPAVRPLS